MILPRKRRNTDSADAVQVETGAWGKRGIASASPGLLSWYQRMVKLFTLNADEAVGSERRSVGTSPFTPLPTEGSTGAHGSEEDWKKNFSVNVRLLWCLFPGGEGPVPGPRLCWQITPWWHSVVEEDVWSGEDAEKETTHLQLPRAGISSDLTDKWAPEAAQDTCLIGRMCRKHGPHCFIKRPDLTKLR